MANLCAPYPSDPHFEVKVEESSSVKLRRSRTRPEAEKIAQQHIQGTIKELFQPAAIKPFRRKVTNNYILKNKRLASHSARTQEEVKPFKSVNFSSRYDHVQPKVTSFIQPTPFKSSISYNRKDKVSKNFVQLNKKVDVRCIKNHSHEEVQSTTTCPLSSTGKLPKYLLHRRQEWHKKKLEEEASRPDSSVPDGHIIMPVQDKHSTLQALEKDKQSLTTELMALPITCYTLKQKQIKGDIETKLGEIDDAIKIFSRPRVFIKVD